MSRVGAVEPTGYYPTFGGGIQGLLGFLIVVGLYSLYVDLFFGHRLAIGIGGGLASAAVLVTAVGLVRRATEARRSRASRERELRDMEAWIDDVAPLRDDSRESNAALPPCFASDSGYWS